MADYVSGEEKCDAPAPNGASVCALPPGHENQHRNAWYAPWPATPRCEARRDVDADTVRGYATFRCGLPIGHPGSHQVERVAGGPLIWKQSAEHTPRPVDPGTRPCGNVGPFGGYTCTNRTGHSGAHEASLAGVRMVWSDVTDESVAKQLAALQRKVRAQANQINKLEDLRRAAVDKQPEYQKLIGQLEAQASLTERENRFRRKAETDQDSERKRRGELIGSLLMDIRSALGDPVDSVPPSWATWSELRKQAGRLINELDKHRERAEAAEGLRSALVKLERRTDELAMGPSAEYGTTPLAARVAELAKDQDSVNRVVAVLNERLSKLESLGQNCTERYSDTGPGRNIACVLQSGHQGVHTDGTGATW